MLWKTFDKNFIKIFKAIKLQKLEERNSYQKEKKELKLWEDRLNKESSKIRSNEEELRIREKEIRSKEDQQKIESERLTKKDEELGTWLQKN